MLGPLDHLFFMAPPLGATRHVLAPLSLNIDLALVHSFIVSLYSAPRTIFYPPTRFCHMYNLADSMVELKHNAQTSKQQWFSFVLESSVS